MFYTSLNQVSVWVTDNDKTQQNRHKDKTRCAACRGAATICPRPLQVVTWTVTGHLSEGSIVRNVVVQILKYDAKPNPNPNLALTLTNSNPNPNLALTLTQTLPLAITLTLFHTFRQMTLRTSELLPTWTTTQSLQFGGHRACRWCGSSYTIHTQSLTFVGFPVSKICLIIRHDVNRAGDLDLCPFDL